MKKLYSFCCILYIAFVATNSYATPTFSSTSNTSKEDPKHKMVPPTNDECSGAINVPVNTDMSCTNTVQGTLNGATASPVASSACAGNEDDDVWFSFTATQTSHPIKLINLFGTTSNLCISVWEGNCNALSFVPGSCYTSYSNSTASNLTIGQTYYVRVYSYSSVSQNTTFNICVNTFPLPPVNDECSGAIPVPINNNMSCTNTALGTVFQATASNLNPDFCPGTEDDDVWFSFVATQAKHFIIITTIQGTNTTLCNSIWTGDCNNLTLVPNSCNSFNYNDPSNLVAGQTYYIRVFSLITESINSTFKVCIETPPLPPINDDSSGAIALTVNSDATCSSVTLGTVQSATPSDVNNSLCDGNEDDDVWYTFVATNNKHKINLSYVQGNNILMNFSVWSGDSSNLNLVPNSCSMEGGITVSGLTIGNTYYLRVYSNDNFPVNTFFNVCISTLPPAPSNDECIGAIALLTVDENTPCTLFGTGTLVGATSSNVDTTQCDGNEDDDVWFSFVATNPSHEVYFSNIQGGTSGLNYSLWEGGNCNNLSILTYSCSPASSSHQIGLTPGETYYIRVFSYGDAIENTSFTICIGNFTPLVNDEYTGAIPLTMNTDLNCTNITYGNVMGATSSAEDPYDCLGSPDDDLWYSFVATQTSHLINLDIITDQKIYQSLWKGNGNNLEFVPDSCGMANSNLVTDLSIGTTYYIRIYSQSGFPNQNIPFGICITTTPPLAVNDECTNSIQLVNGSTFETNYITTTNYMATESILPDSACSLNFGGDVWYKVTIPESGNLTIETRPVPGSVLDKTYMEVLSGDCNNGLNVVACHNGASNNYFAKIALTGQNPGETLYVSIWRNGGGPISTQGEFKLSAFDASVSTTQFDTTHLKYMPNPVKNNFYISYDQIIDKVEVLNILGQNIIEMNNNSTDIQLDLTKLNSGTYLVKVYSNNRSKTIKINKE